LKALVIRSLLIVSLFCVTVVSHAVVDAIPHTEKERAFSDFTVDNGGTILFTSLGNDTFYYKDYLWYFYINCSVDIGNYDFIRLRVDYLSSSDQYGDVFFDGMGCDDYSYYNYLAGDDECSSFDYRFMTLYYVPDADENSGRTLVCFFMSQSHLTNSYFRIRISTIEYESWLYYRGYYGTMGVIMLALSFGAAWSSVGIVRSAARGKSGVYSE